MNKAINDYLDNCIFAGEVFRDYYGEDNEAGYRHDKNVHDTARTRARNILARLGEVTEAEVIKACKEAWSGRLEWDGSHFHYTPGQFGDLEMPQAMCAVIEHIEDNRKN